MTTLAVPITVLPGNDDLPLPAYQSAHAAAMDLHAAVRDPLTVQPGGIALVGCGFAVAVPEGYEAQVRPRSGLAARHGVTVVNTPGTIDADYRGEVKVALVNLGPAPHVVERGQRIAQLLVVPVPRVEWRRVEELPATARGDGGFGHTGVGSAPVRGSDPTSGVLPQLRTLPPAIVLVLAGLTAWPSAQDQPPGDHRWPCVGAPDPTYVETADATGGQVFFFAPEELAQSAVLMTQGDRHDQAVIRQRGRFERTGERTFDVPIDGGVESAYFSVTLQCADEVRITTPRGDEAAQAVSVDDQRFRGGRIVVVPAPIDGMWRVRMRGRGAYMVSVQVRGGVQLERVRFFRAEAPDVPVDPPLRLLQKMEVEVVLEGDVFQAAFELRAPDASGSGGSAQQLDLREVTRDDRRWVFRGPVTVRTPATGVRLHVTGMAAAGRAFQRVQPGLVPVARP